MIATIPTGMLRSAYAGEQLLAMGEHLRILAASEDSAGQLSAFEIRSLPRGGLPPRVHSREDLTLFVLDGTYDISLAGRTHAAAAGSSAFLPRGIPHGYRCTSPGGGRLLVVATPGGLEDFFREAAAEVPELRTDADINRSRELCARSGIVLL